MSNDISGINSSKPQHTTTSRSQVQGGQNTSTTQTNSAGAATESADKVSLTNTAEKLKALEKQLSQEPPVNEQKIANVRAALESGNYQVDPEKIAGKMIDFESYLEK